jgi:hypothetical protein
MQFGADSSSFLLQCIPNLPDSPGENTVSQQPPTLTHAQLWMTFVVLAGTMLLLVNSRLCIAVVAPAKTTVNALLGGRHALSL